MGIDWNESQLADRIKALQAEVESLRALVDDPVNARRVLHAEAQKFLGDPRKCVTTHSDEAATP